MNKPHTAEEIAMKAAKKIDEDATQSGFYMSIFPVILTAIKEAQNQDTARLDWLLNKPGAIAAMSKAWLSLYKTEPNPSGRQAIDQAMKAEK